MNLDMDKYQTEYRIIRKANGELHANVCLLRQQGASESAMNVIRAHMPTSGA